MIEAIAIWWCRTMHERISRPMHGQYQCWECGRKFDVAWEPRRSDAQSGSEKVLEALIKVAESGW